MPLLDETTVTICQTLPMELYRQIFGFFWSYSPWKQELQVDTNTLTTLCRVSRAFRADAEAVLYSAVDLTDPEDDEFFRTAERIKLWSRTVVGCDRIAKLVTSLAIPPLFPELNTSEEEITLRDALRYAFNAVVNLRELNAYVPSRSGIESWPYVDEGCFELCRFRLRTLKVADWSPELMAYISSHHPLNELSMAEREFKSFSWKIFPVGRGPTTVSIECTAEGLLHSDLLTSHLAVERFYWCSSENITRKSVVEEVFTHLATLSGSLKRLYIDGGNTGESSDIDPADVIGYVGKHFPDLMHLSLLSSGSVWGVPVRTLFWC